MADDALEPSPRPVAIAYDDARDRVWSHVESAYNARGGDDTVVAAATNADQSPLLLGDLRMVLHSQDEHLGQDGQWWGPEECFERECDDYTGHEDGGLDHNVDYPCSHLVWVPTWVADAIRAVEPATSTPQTSPLTVEP